MNFETIISQLYALKPNLRRSSLEAYEQFLSALGSPHHHLPPIIHVGGTNGKGSTISFIKSFLNQAGYSTHVYTSPHLRCITERIALNGVPITRSLLMDYLQPVLDLKPQSFFEALTAAAFLIFKDHPADFILLEVGMGGRLDATNVVDPICSVLTSIGLDHEQYLGSTLQAIAREKAGIIKPGRIAVLQGEDPTLRKMAAQLPGDIRLSTLQPLRSALLGPHQERNASLALTVLDAIGITLSLEHKNQALQKVQWPGRFQLIHQPPHTWIIDGAHNTDAALALAQTLKEQNLKKLACVFSLDKNRNVLPFLSPLRPYLKSLYTLREPPNRYPHTHEAIAYACKVLELPCMQLNDFHEIPRHSHHILVTGSLYLAGHALNFLSA